jgi:hypothetical protein
MVLGKVRVDSMICKKSRKDLSLSEKVIVYIIGHTICDDSLDLQVMAKC